MLMAVMGIFKGEYGKRMHILPLVNVTLSGMKIHIWFDRLLALRKEEENTNCPAFYDMAVYMFSASAIESVFHPNLGYINIHRDIKLAYSIPRVLNVREHYWCNHSF